jgi:lipopolysaccharide/colanic/teichoic acid biosynthesis glycosyltransferase
MSTVAAKLLPDTGALPDTLYVRMGKRCCDVLFAACGLLLLSPVLLVCAVLVKISSAGPVIFSQERVGRGGRRFRMVKFRSMCVDAERKGSDITARGDPRITDVGRFLRRTKLDELPQLWNVLKGDMSLVGPRPEVPQYVQLYDAQQRKVLDVRPGITDPATIVYRHEEEVLAAADDPQRHYREVVMPAKLRMNLAYLQNISFGSDVRVIFQTLHVIGSPARNGAQTDGGRA